MAHLLAVHVIVRLVLLFSPLDLELVLPRVLHLDPPLAGPALATLKLQKFQAVRQSLDSSIAMKGGHSKA